MKWMPNWTKNTLYLLFLKLDVFRLLSSVKIFHTRWDLLLVLPQDKVLHCKAWKRSWPSEGKHQKNCCCCCCCCCCCSCCCWCYHIPRLDIQHVTLTKLWPHNCLILPHLHIHYDSLSHARHHTHAHPNSLSHT